MEGDDTFGKVDKLCAKGMNPISNTILDNLGLSKNSVHVGAVCVYHNLVQHAQEILKNKLPVASVSTGFPAGLSSFQTRKKEIMVMITTE